MVDEFSKQSEKYSNDALAAEVGVFFSPLLTDFRCGRDSKIETIRGMYRSRLVEGPNFPRDE